MHRRGAGAGGERELWKRWRGENAGWGSGEKRERERRGTETVRTGRRRMAR